MDKNLTSSRALLIERPPGEESDAATTDSNPIPRPARGVATKRCEQLCAEGSHGSKRLLCGELQSIYCCPWHIVDIIALAKDKPITMSEKQGIVEKIKSTFTLGSRKNEKILRALYRAGRRKAILEGGHHNKDTSSSSVSTSDEEVGRSAEGVSKKSGTHTGLASGGAAAGAGAAYAHHQSKDTDREIGTSGTGAGAGASGAGVAGTRPNAAENAAGAAYSHHHTASSESHPSSKGKVVTLPPRVSRQPLEKDHGGDFANAKNPIEVVGADESQVVTNAHPQYDNGAQAVQGQGMFYDPQDTQGGLYGKTGKTEGTGIEKDYGSSGKTAVGAGAAGATLGGLAGGVGRGGSGPHAEATQAELDKHGNLKTKPSAYYEADKEKEKEKFEKDVEKEAYDQGRAKGEREASAKSRMGSGATGATGAIHATGSSRDAHPTHEENKSAFNEGGVSGAIGDLGKSRSAAGKDTGAGTGTGAKAGAGVGAGAGSSFAGTSQPTDVHAGHPPSSKDFDHDREINRLDKNIDRTQKEIDQYGKTGSSGAGATGAGATGPGPSGTGSTDSKTLDPAQSSQPKGILGTAAAALGFGGGAYAAHRANDFDRTKDSSEAASVASLYNQPGVNSGNGAGASGAKAVESDAYAAGVKKGENSSTGTNLESEAYAAGVKMGEKEGDSATGVGASVAGTRSGHAASDTKGEDPGLFAGAAGAAAAVGAAGAAALGLGHGKSDDKDVYSDAKEGFGAAGTGASRTGVSDSTGTGSTNTARSGIVGTPTYTDKSTGKHGSDSKSSNVAGVAGAGLGAGTGVAAASSGHSKSNTAGYVLTEGVGVPGGPNGLTGQTSTKPTGAVDSSHKSSGTDSSLDKKHSSHSKEAAGVGAGPGAIGATGLAKTHKDDKALDSTSGTHSATGPLGTSKSPGNHVNDKGELSIPTGSAATGDRHSSSTSGFAGTTGHHTAGTTDKGLGSTGPGVGTTGHDSTTASENHGYLDSAKIAIASAGAAAAGAFGYEGYNEYYKHDDDARDVTDRELGDVLGSQATKNVEEKPVTSTNLASKDKPSTSEYSGSVAAADQKLKDPAVAKATEGVDAPIKLDSTKVGKGSSGPDGGVVAPGATDASVATGVPVSHGLTKDDTSSNASSSTPSKKGGFLSRFGIGGGDESASGAETTGRSDVGTADPHASSTGLNAARGGIIGGAMGSAAAAVGLSGQSSAKPLVEAGKYDTNTKASTDGIDSKDRSLGVQEISGLKSHVPEGHDSARKSSTTTNADAHKLEAEVVKHNKEHGHNDDRSLIEIAEDVDPSIKNLTHNAGLTHTDQVQVESPGDSARHRTPH